MVIGVAQPSVHLPCANCAKLYPALLQSSIRSTLHNSNFDQLVGVPAQIPARRVAEVRKQRIYTGIGFLWSRFVMDFSTLHMNHIKNVHLILSELRATARNLITDSTIVARISYREQHRYRQNHTKNRAFNHFSRYFSRRSSVPSFEQPLLYWVKTDASTTRHSGPHHFVFALHETAPDNRTMSNRVRRAIHAGEYDKDDKTKEDETKKLRPT
jgi:hypothetical protein